MPFIQLIADDEGPVSTISISKESAKIRLDKYGNLINNQNELTLKNIEQDVNQIILGNCSNIISVSENKPLVQTPYLIQGVTDNYLPFENSDLKDNYLKSYVYSASKFTPIVSVNNRN